MTTELTFDYHGLAGLRINSSSSWAMDYFSQEYGYAAGSLPASAPLVELRWSESAVPLPPRGGHRLKTHKVLARWFYSVSLHDDRAEIEGAGNRASVPMVHHMLVHPALRYLCSKHHGLLLHGAALSHRGRSIVIAGAGGAGKTTASSLILAHGDKEWRIQGDDYVLIGAADHTHSYATRAHVYRDLLRYLPSLRKRLSGRERLQVGFFGAMRKLTREHVKWPLRMELARLWPGREIAPSARLAAVLLIRRQRSERVEIVPVADFERALEEMVAINFNEARHFIRLVGHTPGSKLPIRWLRDWEMRERKWLAGLLDRVPAYRLGLPEATPGLGERLLSELLPLLEGAPVSHV